MILRDDFIKKLEYNRKEKKARKQLAVKAGRGSK